MTDGGIDRVNAADEVDAIGEFYDRRPYPPPVTDLDRQRAFWDEQQRRVDFHLFWPAMPFREDLDILVAGCGTSQSAKYAACRPGARVTGIDVSATSLEHTDALKRKYDLTNLDIHQLPIEDVGTLGRRFDLIVCTGVLHHLADPDRGLRALASVLTPGGAMHLMVYAPYGRAGLSMLQDYCRRLGFGTSEQDLQALVSALTALPRRHPFNLVLAEFADFQNPDAVADALLNPRERTYSVPEVFDFIEREGLAFGRWHKQAPYMPDCGALVKAAHADRLSALPTREAHAAVELWRGTMTTHSFIAYGGAGVRDIQSISFADTRWPVFIPIRCPYTLCVEQRLPPGAAGVLLNQSHTDTDLVWPIDAYQKRLLNAIDGRRTIDEIVRITETSEDPGRNRKRARAFFMRLWDYDQVVFDASASLP